MDAHQGGSSLCPCNHRGRRTAQPLRIGRNLEVIESTADRRTWQVPFRLGNPENERMPVTLELGGDNAMELTQWSSSTVAR